MSCWEYSQYPGEDLDTMWDVPNESVRILYDESILIK
jgi:RNAse (barnase) inhibitor barstar